jgi:hypothetical protein
MESGYGKAFRDEGIACNRWAESTSYCENCCVSARSRPIGSYSSESLEDEKVSDECAAESEQFLNRGAC